MAVLGTAIQLVHRGADVADDRQFACRVADTQNSLYEPIIDDDPVHISACALNIDVVQCREALAAEEIDAAQVHDQLL